MLQDCDKVRTKFVEMLETFNDNAEVRDLLKNFLPKEARKDNGANSFDGYSSVSGKGAEYVKTKLPKIKNKIVSKLENFQFEFELKESRTTPAKELLDGVNILAEILKVDGKFEKLLREFEEDTLNEKQAEDFEKWKDEYVIKINKLKNDLDEEIKPVASASQKDNTAYQTLFKKISPPTFSGDALDYIEWKLKWQSQVSSCKQPLSYELDRLKEHIPESARRKLFDIKSLPMAWKVLDKLYGDKKLISQKLKNKKKNLKPKSKAPHEVVIEIHDEVDYLVKRLVKLEIKDLLDTDPD